MFFFLPNSAGLAVSGGADKTVDAQHAELPLPAGPAAERRHEQHLVPAATVRVPPDEVLRGHERLPQDPRYLWTLLRGRVHTALGQLLPHVLSGMEGRLREEGRAGSQGPQLPRRD